MRFWLIAGLWRGCGGGTLLPGVAQPLTRSIDQLRSWSSDWAGHRVAVLGLGAAGFALVDTFVELGCDVLALANEAGPDTLRILEALGVVPVVAGDRGLSAALRDFAPEALVLSPGVPADSPVVTAAENQGVSGVV